MTQLHQIRASKPGTLAPGKPTNETIAAIERGRAKLCFNCDPDVFKECVNCYESKSIKVKRLKFQQALKLGIEEDIARKMFIRGDLL